MTDNTSTEETPHRVHRGEGDKVKSYQQQIAAFRDKIIREHLAALSPEHRYDKVTSFLYPGGREVFHYDHAPFVEITTTFNAVPDCITTPDGKGGEYVVMVKVQFKKLEAE